jgi:hypothetical protein
LENQVHAGDDLIDGDRAVSIAIARTTRLRRRCRNPEGNLACAAGTLLAIDARERIIIAFEAVAARRATDRSLALAVVEAGKTFELAADAEALCRDAGCAIEAVVGNVTTKVSEHTSITDSQTRLIRARRLGLAFGAGTDAGEAVRLRAATYAQWNDAHAPSNTVVVSLTHEPIARPGAAKKLGVC